MDSTERLTTALDIIKRWMRAHGAPLLVENLADGATEAELAEAEKAVGFPLPEELRALWALHFGQHEEGNGFVEFRDLFDVRGALADRDTVDLSLEFLREHPEDWEEAGMDAAEAKSYRWIAFAGRDSELLVVCGESGRVFACEKDSPPFRRIADGVVEWAEQYAAQVAADDYAVEEGFGDYYLELRDRGAERREQAREEKRQAKARYQRETPLLEQLGDGLSNKDDDACRDVFERLVDEADATTLTQGIELLFATTRDDALVATALQFVLRKVTLSPEQWTRVADGASALGNNAIASLAASHLPSKPVAPPPKPWWKVW